MYNATIAALLSVVCFTAVHAAPSVTIVTSLPEKPCSGVTGNHINLMALSNKVDYAAAHRYDVHWTRAYSDTTLRGPWNKVALMVNLLQTRLSSTQPQWLAWVDADAIFANMSLALPLDRYRGKDVIIPGDAHKALVDLDAEGINTGVMLVRVSPRSLAFFQELAALGQQMQSNTSSTTKVVQGAIRRYHAGLYDQNALVYLLKARPAHQEVVFFEPVGGYGLHSHFVANLPLPMIGCAFCPEAQRVAIYGLHYCVKHFASIYNAAVNMTNAAGLTKQSPMPVKELIWRLEGVDPMFDREFKN